LCWYYYGTKHLGTECRPTAGLYVADG
ncbi:hypothetical protein D043_4153B, partial [Vibrio parahaemolyticus EKP-021]